MKFEFATATRIVFGAPVSGIGDDLAALGGPVLLVTGRDAERSAPLRALLHARGLATHAFVIAGEPTLEGVRSGRDLARAEGCRTVVGLGGGSVLDAGKAVAALVTNDGDPLDYLEVVGRGRALTQPAAPYVAIPTTAGTGSEVTRNAVLTSPEHGVKGSLRSALMLPRLAWIDPSLSVSMPPALTASTGMDALSQVLEAFVCNEPNALVEPLCRDALARASRSLSRACEHGGDLEARSDMSFVSLVGGLALANARLGAVHGFAAPLGGLFDAPHGALCAALLAPVVQVNLEALRARAPGHPAVARYSEAAQILTGRATASSGDIVAWLSVLSRRLAVRPLSAYGVRAADLQAVSEKAARASSMRGNPLSLTPAERIAVLERAL